jgi:hypothetical protein
MTEQSQDFEMWAGEYKEITILVKKPDGTPEDLTGATVEWLVKKRPQSNLPALVSKSSGHGAEVLVPPTAGLVKITLDEADTTSLPASTYYHELEGKDSADRPFTPTVGYLVIQPSAIRG